MTNTVPDRRAGAAPPSVAARTAALHALARQVHTFGAGPGTATVAAGLASPGLAPADLRARLARLGLELHRADHGAAPADVQGATLRLLRGGTW
jgi:hypothetical protein